MPTFPAPDGTRLSYRVTGEGDPVVCIPGGPADSIYLGDLGGLSTYRRLIVLDLRGTGRSAIPQDASSYRCDRLIEDVEALREHLGLPRVNLLGHLPARTSRRNTRLGTRRTSAGSPSSAPASELST